MTQDSDLTRWIQRFTQIFALLIDGRINLVGQTVVALVFFKADIMRSGAYPPSFSSNIHRRFPNSQIMALLHHLHRFSVLVTKVLHSPKQIQLAHGHG